MNPIVALSGNEEKDIVASLRANSKGHVVAHYELYKQVSHLQGCIVNCGVEGEEHYESFALLRNLLGNGQSQKVVSFEKYSRNMYFDNTFLPFGALFYKMESVPFNMPMVKLRLQQQGIINHDDSVKGHGWESIPQYLIENPELKISFLVIDADDYETSMTALQFLYPRLMHGGMLVLDSLQESEEDYAAVCDYFEERIADMDVHIEGKGVYYMVKK